MHNRLAVCGDGCVHVSLAKGIPTTGIFTKIRHLILEFLNDCLAAAGVSKATV